jgi:hypothetical protein
MWIVAAVQLLVHLWRARPAVELDALHHPGFAAKVVPLAHRAEDSKHINRC